MKKKKPDIVGAVPKLWKIRRRGKSTSLTHMHMNVYLLGATLKKWGEGGG